MEPAVQMHAEHASPFGMRQLIEGHAVEDARVAHDRVEPTERVDRGTNDRLAALWARHGLVGRRRHTARALDLFDDLVSDGEVRALAVHRASEVVHHHRPAAPRDLRGIEAAETSASARDDHSLAREVYHAPAARFPDLPTPA